MWNSLWRCPTVRHVLSLHYYCTHHTHYLLSAYGNTSTPLCLHLLLCILGGQVSDLLGQSGHQESFHREEFQRNLLLLTGMTFPVSGTSLSTQACVRSFQHAFLNLKPPDFSSLLFLPGYSSRGSLWLHLQGDGGRRELPLCLLRLPVHWWIIGETSVLQGMCTTNKGGKLCNTSLAKKLNNKDILCHNTKKHKGALLNESRSVIHF